MVEVTDVNMMHALIGKLYEQLTAEDKNVSLPMNDFISWCVPGFPFQPEDLEFASKGINIKDDANKTRELTAQAFDFASLVNLNPKATGIYDKEQQQTTYSQTGTSLWNIYEKVLRDSEVVSGELTDQQKEKLEKFRKLLRTTKKNLVTDEEEAVDGPVLIAYNEKMIAYLDAAAEYNTARISAENSDSTIDVRNYQLNGLNLRRKVKAAWDAWTSGGYRNEVDQMNAYIDQVTQRDMTIWKQWLQEQLRLSKITDLINGLDFNYTSFIPSRFLLNRNPKTGWVKFDFDEKHLNTYHKNVTNSWEGGAGISTGLFNAAVWSKGSINSDKESIDVSNFKMSFWYTQLIISRPWFFPEFLESTAWRFNPDSSSGEGNVQLSDGKIPPDGPNGDLIAYPTAIILVKDIWIDFAELHKEESKYKAKIEAKGGVSYGPFVLGGGYGRDDDEKQVRNNDIKGGLGVEGMQIIGFRCNLLRKSPNPNPNIKSWA